MEQTQQAQAQAKNKYEMYLRLFRQYFQYVVIIALGYVVTYQKKENETLREKVEARMQKDIDDKADAIKAWRKTKDNDNEILEKMLDKIGPVKSGSHQRSDD